jgi:hypothetical protein
MTDPVKRISRILIILITAAIVLAALGLLAINLYIQSPGIQQNIRNAVSQNIGLPIDVFRISYTPWDGFVFQNVTIHDPKVNFPLLHAERLKIQCNYLGVFHRNIDISEVSLQKVDINLPIRTRTTKNPEANPETQPSAIPPSNTTPRLIGVSPTPSTSPTPNQPAPATIPAIQQAGAQQQAKIKRYLTFRNPLPHHFWVEVKKLKIHDGAVHLLRDDDSMITELRGLECSIRAEKKNYVGKIKVDETVIGDSIYLSKLESPLLCTPEKLDLANMHATLADGSINGSFSVNLNQEHFPYHLALQMSGVQLNDVTHDIEFFERTHGIIKGSLTLIGRMSDPSLARGQGNIIADSAYLDENPMLREIGRWTQIEELQRLRLNQASAAFRVIGPNISIDLIQLISKNCELTLNGMLAGDGLLNLNGRLIVSHFLSSKIPNELSENFRSLPEKHTRYVDFKVNGSLQQPQTDLVDRILGDKRKLLKKILGEGKERHR